MNCAAQRGFLTLGDCESPMASMCTSCGRPMCAAHLSMQSGFTQCIECTSNDPTVAKDEEEYDTGWSHRYRDDYYRDTGYHGVSSSSYDDTDAASFDNTTGEGEFEDDGGTTGAFGES